MDNFLRYFYQDLGRVFKAFGDAVAAILNFFNYLLNYPMRVKIIQSYDQDFSTKEWIMLLVANIALFLLIVLIFYLQELHWIYKGLMNQIFLNIKRI